jgi:hypothetical protein
MIPLIASLPRDRDHEGMHKLYRSAQAFRKGRCGCRKCEECNDIIDGFATFPPMSGFTWISLLREAAILALVRSRLASPALVQIQRTGCRDRILF